MSLEYIKQVVWNEVYANLKKYNIDITTDLEQQVIDIVEEIITISICKFNNLESIRVLVHERLKELNY